MPIFIELHIDGEPKLFAIHDLLRIGDHYITCSNNLFRVDESYAEISAILDHFDCIVRKEVILAQQIKELINRGFLDPHDVTEADMEQMLQTDP